MSVLRRLVPDGLAGRFVLMLAVALVAANLVALAVLSYERAVLDRQVLLEREVERITSLVPALEATPTDQRTRVARHASTRFSRVAVDRTPIIETQPTDASSMSLARRLASLTSHDDIRATIRKRSSRHGGQRQAVIVSIRLVEAGDGDAQWLNITSHFGNGRPAAIAEDVFILILGLSLVCVLGAGLLFTRRLTRPLRELADAAQAAGQGNRMVRVPVAGPREMREAARAFNEMQSQIASFDAERMRTLAAVGHDLRTPITSLRIRAEMLDGDEAAPMIRTLDEMTLMADGLVSYARGTGEAEEARTIDLEKLLEELCEQRGAAFESRQNPKTVGRPVSLGRAFGNIIDNAIRYGGSARVALGRDADGSAAITVDDDGPGIAPDNLSAVLEPFVRGETSRNAETGGAGLGLSIARSIVSAHAGSMVLENRAEGGLRVTIRLP